MRNKDAKQNEKEKYAMIDAWGLGVEESDTKEVDENAFMAAGDSYLGDEETFEVSILELKEKLD